MEDTAIKHERIDTYLVDMRAGFIKTRIIVTGAVVCVLFSVIICAIIMKSGSKRLREEMRIIDRQGYTYSSEVINQRTATEYQAKAFILNFVKLCYQFDPNNIENSLNRALQLGDETVAGFIETHSQPNDIYQSVKSFGRTAYVYEQQIADNIKLAGNSFQVIFVQIIRGSGIETRYTVTIAGKMEFITPNSIDNPNGFYIREFIEQYQRQQNNGF